MYNEEVGISILTNSILHFGKKSVVLSAPVPIWKKKKAMAWILGDVSDGFDDDGVFWHNFMSEPVVNINGCALIDTGGVVWVYAVGLSFDVTVNATIK